MIERDETLTHSTFLIRFSTRHTQTHIIKQKEKQTVT